MLERETIRIYYHYLQSLCMYDITTCTDKVNLLKTSLINKKDILAKNLKVSKVNYLLHQLLMASKASTRPLV